jgi:hypothetical protein
MNRTLQRNHWGLRSAVTDATVIDVPRQSKTPSADQGDVARTRKRFAERLKKRIITELGVPEKDAVGWLAEKMGVRWQTAQYWLDGESFPLGHNLTRLGEAVGVDPRELIGPLTDDVEPTHPTWKAFLETPEGKSLSDEERWALRLFWWPKPPTVGDYRSLLALVRTNNERGAG